MIIILNFNSCCQINPPVIYAIFPRIECSKAEDRTTQECKKLTHMHYNGWY